MGDHRYRLPDYIKEREAEALKRRFEAYSETGPRAKWKNARQLAKLLLSLAIALAVYRWLRRA